MTTNDLNNTLISPKLSVVVIAYNNELYIEEALESLHQQTFNELEICVVNDHSTDRTGELIDRFIEGKPKFKAIHLEQNSGGCSVPRNTGIANTIGQFIMFLDGDDWYTVDACEKMVAGIERTDSDFVAGQVIRTNNYEIWYHKQIYSQERTNINVREFNTLLFDSLSVNKIYKRTFLDSHLLRFPEGIHYEDIVFTGKAYFSAESISIIPEPIYYWRVVEDAEVKSITNQTFEFSNFENRITAHRMFDQFLKENGDLLYQSNKNNKFLRHDLRLYTNDYLSFDEDYKNRFHELIYNYMHEVMDEYAFYNLPEKDRIMYYLLYIGDKDAFQDYLRYINGLPTKRNRLSMDGNDYYFVPSVQVGHQIKFLLIKEPEIDFTIQDIHLDEKNFSFQSKAEMLSINNDEMSFSWMLRNRQTKETLYSTIENGQRAVFSIENLTPGNYYLFLIVFHQGELHTRLVKKDKIVSLPNLKTVDGSFSKALFVNSKNSFAIKVMPIKAFDRIKWMVHRNKNKANEKENSVFKERWTGAVKSLFSKLPIKKHWVVFESHMGKQYSDSPKYIYEKMVQGSRDFKFIWSFENTETIHMPGPAIKVKRNSLKHYYYLVRSKYWVDNQGMARLAKKREDQVYLQTWHGTPLKKMGYDQNSRPDQLEQQKLRIQTKAWDYFISPNSYSTEIFKRAFRYGGKILETGYPRNDLLVQRPTEISEKVKEHFNIKAGKKVILFAPTFRDWDPHSFQKTVKDILELSQSIGKDAVIIMRLHYLLSSKLSYVNLPENIINASEYDDIQELYLISDLLITDYSSVMFDFALLKRPIILYCYDLDEYLSRRGMYFDLFENAPGPVCFNIDQITAYIKNDGSLNEYSEALNRFALKFGALEDGNAAEKVIKQVFG